VTLALAAFYSKQERYEDLLALCKEYLKQPRSFRVAAQLVNYVGNYYVMTTQFGELNTYVPPLMHRYKGKEPLYETTRYWTGLSEILLADYGKAAKTMKAFLKDYDDSSNYYEDVFYRYGICLYGLEQKKEAEDQFTKFVKKYPESALRGEAELYLGDLKRERRAYAESAQHYRNVEPNTDNPAFIAKASFALAEVLEIDSKQDEAIEVLKTYIERHGETGQLADAYYRLGMIYDRLGMYDVRFGFHAEAIQLLGDDEWRYAVDQLIADYVKDYVRYDKTFNTSTALLDRLISEPAFRKQFLNDRVYQYQFMQSEEGVFLERSLANKLVRDRDFRAKIIETEIQINPETGEEIPPKGPIITAEMAIVQLDTLYDFYAEKSEKLAPHTPGKLFGGLLKQAKSKDQYALEMRCQMALDSLKPEDERGEILYTYQELTSAPPAVINWAAAKRETSNPDEAIKLYTFAMKRHPYAPSAYESVLAMAELSLRQAEASGAQEDWEKALAYYNMVTERYAMKIKNADPHLKKGRVLSELGRDQEAIDVLGMILRNPAWKGLNHAEAHLELGMAYRRQGQLAEAHGFFERLIVAYGGYLETVSWAYYYDLLTLKEMGESESVQQLLEEYRTRLSVLEKTEAYPLINETFTL
ncbi:MAG: tetratricopeptide repeat protein, partial [Coraliomargarita sp.]